MKRDAWNVVICGHMCLLHRVSRIVGVLCTQAPEIIRIRQAALEGLRSPINSLQSLRSTDNLWGQHPADQRPYLPLETHMKALVRRGLAQGSLAEGLTWVGPDQDDLASLAQEARAAIQSWGRPHLECVQNLPSMEATCV